MERDKRLLFDAGCVHRRCDVPVSDRYFLRIRRHVALRRGQRPRHRELGQPPLLTMRLLAEEQKLGTLELLMTAPVRDWEVVLGKYIASLIMFSATIILTLYYVLLLYVFGQPDTGPVLSSYLGLMLHGAAALAVGLLGSSLSANQIVAAVVGIAVLLMLSFVDRVGSLVSGVAADVLNGLSLNAHVTDFTRGVIDTANVVYFLSITAVFLFLTIRSMETRRWR